MPKRPSKFLLWVGSTVVLLLACGFGILMPGMEQMSTSVQTITTLQHDQLITQTNLKNLINLKQHNTDLDQALTTLGEAFVPANNPLPFVTKIEDLANLNHVELQINIGQPDKTSQQSIFPVTTDLTITGQWSDCMTYLQTLMADPTYITIKQISLAGSTDHVTVTIHGLTYWLQ